MTAAGQFFGVLPDAYFGVQSGVFLEGLSDSISVVEPFLEESIGKAVSALFMDP